MKDEVLKMIEKDKENEKKRMESNLCYHGAEKEKCELCKNTSLSNQILDEFNQKNICSSCKEHNSKEMDYDKSSWNHIKSEKPEKNSVVIVFCKFNELGGYISDLLESKDLERYINLNGVTDLYWIYPPKIN